MLFHSRYRKRNWQGYSFKVHVRQLQFPCSVLAGRMSSNVSNRFIFARFRQAIISLLSFCDWSYFPSCVSPYCRLRCGTSVPSPLCQCKMRLEVLLNFVVELLYSVLCMACLMKMHRPQLCPTLADCPMEEEWAGRHDSETRQLQPLVSHSLHVKGINCSPYNYSKLPTVPALATSRCVLPPVRGTSGGQQPNRRKHNVIPHQP